MDTIVRTSQKLRSESKLDIGNDKVEDIAIGLLTGIGNIMKSSSLTQNRIYEKTENNVTATTEDKQNLNDVSNNDKILFSRVFSQNFPI